MENAYAALKTIHRIVVAIISTLPNLHRLHLAFRTALDFDWTPMQLLRYVSCPTLCAFKLDGIPRDESEIVYDFLRRHNQLQDIKLGIQMYYISHTLPQVFRMPKLVRYEAPMAYFGYLSEDTPLEHASINFNRVVDVVTLDDIYPVFLRLRPMTTLKFLCVVVDALSLGLIKMIADNIPGLEELAVEHMYWPYALPRTDVSLYNRSFFLYLCSRF